MFKKTNKILISKLSFSKKYQGNYEKYFLNHKHTHGDKNLHTLLVKHFNDGQSSERSIDKVTYFNVGDLFCIHHGTKYANLQEKIFADISGRMFQTLYSSNFTTIQSLYQCSAQNSVHQASHCSALLIGCVDFCPRVYKGHCTPKMHFYRV